MNKPRVSIGMPVYNNIMTIHDAIETILNQSFEDFELIISDNASTDGTAEACQMYAKSDDRILYIRQKKNIGSDMNFEYVYRISKGEYFMWAPSHYKRSTNFIEANLNLLEKNNGYAFSSSPNCFAGEEGDPSKLVTFSIEGSLYKRISKFLDNRWVSHACYYSLFRRSALDDYPDISSKYLANDWAIDLHLLSKGNFARTQEGLMILGFGQSKQPGFISRSKTKIIEHIFPFYEFSRRAGKLVLSSREISAIGKTLILLKILSINIASSLTQLRVLIKKIAQ